MGEYYQEPDKNVLSKQAFRVRYAYFDKTRQLVDAIPHPLLVRMPDSNAAGPEDDFAELVVRRRERKRDARGGSSRKCLSPRRPLPRGGAATAEPGFRRGSGRPRAARAKRRKT